MLFYVILVIVSRTGKDRGSKYKGRRVGTKEGNEAIWVEGGMKKEKAKEIQLDNLK